MKEHLHQYAGSLEVLPKQKTAVKYLTGHTQVVECLAASSHTIASGAADETVRLLDRKTGACRHILQLPDRPSALHLLSDDLTVGTCWRSCSVWKGSCCLRSICPDLPVPPQTTNSSHISASAVSDNLLFLGFDCAITIQVWDLYSSLQVQIFSPVLSDSSVGDHRITALAAGTVHGHQILLAGVCNAACEHKVLVLHPNDGEAAASPILLPSGKWLEKIVCEDGIALATLNYTNLMETYSVPMPIHLSKAQVPMRQGRPTFTASIITLSAGCPGPASESHCIIGRQHNLAESLLLVSVERDNHPHPIKLRFCVMAEKGLRATNWYKHCPAVTQPEKHWPYPIWLADTRREILVHSCGLLVTTTFHLVAVWQFPSSPD